MEDKNNTQHLRKLRKIKRPQPEKTAPISFGVPSKINSVTSPRTDDHGDDNYFANRTDEGLQSASGSAENIRFVSNEELAAAAPETIADLIKNKAVIMLMALAVIFGALCSYMLLPSRHSGAAGRGLDGIVFNPDVPAGRSRCGLVEPHQGCVLYIMNPRNQEIAAKEFYTTASRWTQRERYLIEIGNMHYGSTIIKPGYIAQINIPPLSY